MIPVGGHGLGCLDPGDYAATALYMQAQGDLIDGLLDATRDTLDVYINRLAFIATTGVSSSFASVGGQVMPDGREANAPTFAGGTVVGGGATVTFVGSLVTFVPPLTGWYDVGGYANVVPAAGVTVGSERVLYLNFLQTPSNPAFPLNKLYQVRVTESNTGGEYPETSATIYMEAGRTASLQLLVSHQNVASNLVVNAGAKIWVSYWTAKGQVIVSA